MFDNNDRASIVRWHENSARAHDHMAAEQPEQDRFPNLELASWHRSCADAIVNRKDLGEPQGFHGHPFRDAWLATKRERAQ